jgi:phage I-like protein
MRGLAVLTLRVQAGDARIRLMPAGRFEAPRGAMAGTGPWTLSAAGAAKIIALNAVRQADILVDYEHQLLKSGENGKEVPAAGWIDPRSLVWVEYGAEPGLYGSVSWTAKAAAMIEADQYRYLSPVFPYDQQTGEPTDVFNVALTNFPAIDVPVRAALSAALPALRAEIYGPPLDHHGIDVFNRAFASMGVLHPDTVRMVGACSLDLASYLASVGAAQRHA